MDKQEQLKAMKEISEDIYQACSNIDKDFSREMFINEKDFMDLKSFECNVLEYIGTSMEQLIMKIEEEDD